MKAISVLEYIDKNGTEPSTTFSSCLNISQCLFEQCLDTHSEKTTPKPITSTH